MGYNLKRKKPRISKRPTRRELDALWAETIKARARYVSERSGKGRYEGVQLHAHHINGKSSHALRWDLSNGVCITGGEHKFVAHHTARAPSFRRWAMRLRGTTEEEVEIKSRGRIRVELFGVKAYLKAMITKYKGGSYEERSSYKPIPWCKESVGNKETEYPGVLQIERESEDVEGVS